MNYYKIKTLRKKLKNNLLYYENKNIASIDCEFVLKNNKYIITEVGYTLKSINNNYTKHFIIEENINFCKKRKFLYGETKYGSLNDVLSYLNEDLKNVELITGVGISQDIYMLKNIGLKIDDFSIVDLNEIINYFNIKQNKSNSHLNDISLKNISKALHYTPEILHNAGNDSYYSVKNFCSLVKMYKNCNYGFFIKNIKENYLN